MKADLKRLQAQMRADFELTWAMVREQGNHLDARIDALESSMGEVKRALQKAHSDTIALGHSLRETSRQWQGRMRQQEQRFNEILEVVVDEGADLDDEIEAIKRRLDELEKRLPPAA